MQPVARHSDHISHGGSITGACSPSTRADGLAVARLNDTVTCNIHSTQHIVSASTIRLADGLGVARLGDLISCGATITTGSPSTETD